jgi:hypothetical protein
MTIAQLQVFVETVRCIAYPCKFGHTGCAVRPGGRCSDELWQQQCCDESDTDYAQRLEENDFPAEDDE